MHIVPGLHLIEDMIKAKTMWTLSGHQLTFTSQVRNLLKAWATVFTQDRLELRHGFLDGLSSPENLFLWSKQAPLCNLKQGDLRPDTPSNHISCLTDNQESDMWMVFPCSLYEFCSGEETFPYAISSCNIHVADMEEATESLFRLNAPLEFVCLDTATFRIFPLLVSLFPPFYFIFLSPPSKDIFILVFWYGRLFFSFSNWLIFSGIHCSLSPSCTFPACMLTGGRGVEPCVSSLRIQPWPRGLGHNTSKGQNAIGSRGIRTECVNAPFKILSCLFTQEPFDLGSLPSPSFVSESSVMWTQV